MQSNYLKEKNRIRRELMGNKRLRLTNARRRRLAQKAKVVGRAALRELACIVTPDPRLGEDTVGITSRCGGRIIGKVFEESK